MLRRPAPQTRLAGALRLRPAHIHRGRCCRRSALLPSCSRRPISPLLRLSAGASHRDRPPAAVATAAATKGERNDPATRLRSVKVSVCQHWQLPRAARRSSDQLVAEVGVVAHSFFAPHTKVRALYLGKSTTAKTTVLSFVRLSIAFVPNLAPQVGQLLRHA